MYLANGKITIYNIVAYVLEYPSKQGLSRTPSVTWAMLHVMGVDADHLEDICAEEVGVFWGFVALATKFAFLRIQDDLDPFRYTL